MNDTKDEMQGQGVEWVKRRTLDPNPYTNRYKHVGNASTIVSSLKNSERMFEYYHDLKDFEAEDQDADATVSSETSNGDATFTRSRSAASASTRALKWQASPGMALWGSVRHLASSPLSHNTVKRAGPVNASFSSSAPNLSREIAASLGLSQECERSGKDAAMSVNICDDENLSSSMKRSLNLLNMMPYRGPRPNSALGQRSRDDVSNTSSQNAATLARDASSGASAPGGLARATSSGFSQSAAELSLLGPGGKPKAEQKVQAGKKDKGHKPQELYGEFVRMRNALDAANGVGGVKVGFGGLSLLGDHVSKGLVTSETPLVIEVEFCTHGFDCVSRGDKQESKYYNHYMRVCDVLEVALFPNWNICFVIKKGKPRQGSFEVELLWVVGSLEYSVTLSSKICSGKFPSPENIVRRVLGVLSPPEAPPA